MREVVVTAAVRTPIGRIKGALSAVRPDDLAALVIAEAVRRAAVDPATVDEVVLGCANQAGEDNRNVARMALLLAGLPQAVPGITVNRLCASGLSAVNMAARAIMVGDSRTDERAARNAGLPFVFLPFGYEQESVEAIGADAVVTHYSLLPSALSRFVN